MSIDLPLFVLHGAGYPNMLKADMEVDHEETSIGGRKMGFGLLHAGLPGSGHGMQPDAAGG
jgi:hypothetical protein